MVQWLRGGGRGAISGAHSIIMNEPHRNIPCLHPLGRSAARTDRPHFIFSLSHISPSQLFPLEALYSARLCAQSTWSARRDARTSARSLAHEPTSLIKGGVTRVPPRWLAQEPRALLAIGPGHFYKSDGPRGLVYLFRRRRRGRGGRPGGIRAISKGGRNTAIFIRAAGMQSRSGAGSAGGAGEGEAAAILRAALFIRFSRGVRRRRERGVR